jgi:hypothetical protein
MSDFDTRLEQAEVRLDRAQAAIDTIGQVLDTAAKAKAASERARSSLRTTNGLLLAAAVGAGALVFVLLRRH